MSNRPNSGPEQLVPRPHGAVPLPKTGETVWSDFDAQTDMLLDASQIVDQSWDAWHTTGYGQLAVDLAGSERSMLAEIALNGELDEAGRVVNAGWNHWRMSGEFPAEPLSFEEVVSRAAVGLREQHFLSPMQLRAGNLAVRAGRAKVLNVVPQPLTYESARRAVQAKVYPPHGAFGKAYDALAMAVGLRNAPLERNLGVFEPDDIGWISERDLLRLAYGVGMTTQRIKTLQGKIRQLLCEQVETGAPVPAGEVVVEGACALKADSRSGLPKVSYEYISCDSFLSVFAEYSSRDRGYMQARTFFEWLAGRPIALEKGAMSSLERRQSRATFNLDQTI